MTSFYYFIFLWCLAWLLTVHIWLYGSPYYLVTLSLSNFSLFVTAALALVLAYYTYQIFIVTPLKFHPHRTSSSSNSSEFLTPSKMNAPKHCARCSKIVYPPEELKCLDKIWHKMCFKCSNPECGMALSMNNYSGYNKLPWCKVHVPQAQATAMTATPEMARLAENTRQQSSVAYKGVIAEKADMEMRREMNAADLAEQNGMDRRMSGPDFTQHLVTPKQVAQMGFNVNRAQQEEQKTQRKVGSLADYEPNKWEEEQSQPQLHPSQQPAQIIGASQSIHGPPPPQQMPQPQQQPQQYAYAQPPQQQQQQPGQHAVSLDNRGTVFGQRSPVGQAPQTTTWSPSGGQQNRQQQQQQPGYLSTPSPTVIEPGHDIHERTGPIIVGSGKSPDVRYVKPWSPNTGSAPPQSYQQPQQQQFGGINSPSPIGQQYSTPLTPSPTPWSSNLNSSQQHQPQQPQQQQFSAQKQQPMYSPPQTTSPVQQQQQPYGAGGAGANLYEQHRQQMTQQNQQRPQVQSPAGGGGGYQQPQPQPKYGGHPGVGAAYGAAAAGANRPMSGGAAGGANQFKAIYDYNARDADEVSFRNGDVIVNTQNVGQGWMQGQVSRTGQRGLLPANYVAPL